MRRIACCPATCCSWAATIQKASLSEPHASLTALRMCVCIYLSMLRSTTYRKSQMSTCKYFTKINTVKHVKATGTKMAEVEECMAT